ncbi:MAG: tetratricopeptide repeat protein, partial [Candidatus Hydrogenedentes bacterium]|nr:tetratricopeptide repeat protein [Candidatus Hydrogenedentota bacterium]
MRHNLLSRLASVLVIFVAILTSSFPSHSQDAIHYNTAGVELYKSGDYAGATRMLEIAYSLAPDNKTIQSNLTNAHLAAAKELVEANEVDAAIEELSAALELRDDDADLYVYTASLCLNTGDPESAEGMLLSALDIAPEHKNAHLLLGEAY